MGKLLGEMKMVAYKGVMVSLIVGMRTSISYVVRLCDGTWLKDLMGETIPSTHVTGFNIMYD